MTVAVKHIETPTLEMNEDGEFVCPHYDVEVEYEIGGDGITEPRGGWTVYCPDCQNEDMTDSQVEAYIDSANEPPEEDWRDE